MNSDKTTARLESRQLNLCRALAALDTPDALNVLACLSAQPRTNADMRERLDASEKDWHDLVMPLAQARVIEPYTREAWRLTLLGRELWTALRPLFDAR